MPENKPMRCDARGGIVLAQENRFRLQAVDGRSLLFVVGEDVAMHEVTSLASQGRSVVVCYRGALESGAVATRIVPV